MNQQRSTFDIIAVWVGILVIAFLSWKVLGSIDGVHSLVTDLLGPSDDFFGTLKADLKLDGLGGIFDGVRGSAQEVKAGFDGSIREWIVSLRDA